MNSSSETAEDDVNPVYATYEIHDDPVAEERPQFFSIFQTFLRITHFIPWYTTYDLLPPGVWQEHWLRSEHLRARDQQDQG